METFHRCFKAQSISSYLITICSLSIIFILSTNGILRVVIKGSLNGILPSIKLMMGKMKSSNRTIDMTNEFTVINFQLIVGLLLSARPRLSHFTDL